MLCRLPQFWTDFEFILLLIALYRWAAAQYSLDTAPTLQQSPNIVMVIVLPLKGGPIYGAALTSPPPLPPPMV